MKEEIEEWKKYNGNVTYSTKELLQGIHIKIDNHFKDINDKIELINNRCIGCNNTISENKNNITWHKRFILGLYSIIGFIVYIVIKNAEKLKINF